MLKYIQTKRIQFCFGFHRPWETFVFGLKLSYTFEVFTLEVGPFFLDIQTK